MKDYILFSHSRVDGNPGSTDKSRISAFAGMTRVVCHSRVNGNPKKRYLIWR